MSAITFRVRGDVVVLEPATRTDLSDDQGLRPLVRQHADDGFKKYVLNLHRVPYIDSTGIGGLARTAITVAQRGGRLKICAVSQRVRDLMEVTKLTPIFELYAAEDDAVGSFKDR
ncbi:MAG TPA: STAS domain-containing protein [Vicinamibacterales bacterium]|nr:STAS domain-containing protein [Vicinamibacterales bacterium]